MRVMSCSMPIRSCGCTLSPKKGKKEWKAHKHHAGRAPDSVMSCVKGKFIVCNQPHASAQAKRTLR
jgi:hypothetical protein